MLIFRGFCPFLLQLSNPIDWSGVDAYGRKPFNILYPDGWTILRGILSALLRRAGGAAGGPGGLPPRHFRHITIHQWKLTIFRGLSSNNITSRSGCI